MDDVRAVATGRWPEILTSMGVDGSLLDGKHRACPACGGKDRFRFDDKDGRGTHICSQCGAGDGFVLVGKVLGLDGFREQAESVEGVLGITGTPPTAAEQQAYREKLEQQRIQRELEQAEAKQKAAAKALRVWEASSQASEDHGYLKAKGVKAYGIKQSGNQIVVPVRVDGNISSLQFIGEDGSKKFIKDSAIDGGYHSIPGEAGAGDRIYIAEGYATAATIREVTGCCVAVAFNAGNLLPVAKAIRSKLPDKEITIAGDNDESGTGEKKGKAAAAAVGGVFMMPPEVGKDWNDWAAAHGLEALRELWDGVRTESDSGLCAIGVPVGYSCSRAGVWIEHDDRNPERLTDRAVWVSALSRDGGRDNWGRMVQWFDHDNHQHERAIPAAMFHSNGNELAQEMATAGLPIVPGKERKLLQYLSAFAPPARLTAATSTGWHGDAFVMPDMTINEPEGERIVYQSNEYRATGCMRSSGTFEDWREMVASVSPLVKFAISASLSAPLRLLSRTAAGGFHFYGRTSHGKTTLLQAACSVWGNAADPAMAGGGDVYIQRWNATRNGLEGMAASFNDLPLIVDEIGENDGKDFGRIVYALMSGTGKTRATRSGGISKTRAWRITLLSSGELPVSDFIEGAKGGQLVRLVDIEAADIFAGRDEADAMKHGCAKQYGHAGIEFIQGGNLLDGFDDITADSIGDAPTPEAGRVRDRFRLVAHAGELAIRRGILPWMPGEVLQACQSIYARWKVSSHAMSDAERGIENVRNFLLAYGDSRFEQECGNRDPIDRAGSYAGGIFNFIAPAFKEACGGVLPDTVKGALADRGLLFMSEQGRHTSKATIGGKRVRAVCVRDDILSDDVKQAGQPGQVGQPLRHQ